MCPVSVSFLCTFQGRLFLRGRGGGRVGFETYKKWLSRGSEVKYFIKILKWHNVLILKAL